MDYAEFQSSFCYFYISYSTKYHYYSQESICKYFDLTKALSDIVLSLNIFSQISIPCLKWDLFSINYISSWPNSYAQFKTPFILQYERYHSTYTWLLPNIKNQNPEQKFSALIYQNLEQISRKCPKCHLWQLVRYSFQKPTVQTSLVPATIRNTSSQMTDLLKTRLMLLNK